MNKILSMLLLAALSLTLLTGCGNTKDNGGASNSVALEDTGVEGNDYTKLTMVLPVNGTEPVDGAKVAEEISKITRKKIGAEVEFKYVSSSTYSEQLNLMLSSEEKADLVYVPAAANGVAIAQNGAFYGLNELLSEYGQGILDAVGQDVIKDTRIEGETYLVPTCKENARGYGILARKDILEALDIEPKSITSLEAFGDVLRRVKAAYPDIILHNPNAVTSVGIGAISMGDRLADDIGVLMDATEAKPEVVNLFATEEYRAYVTLMHQWCTEGLIGKDVLNQTKDSASLAQAGKLFSFTSHQTPGTEIAIKNLMGYDYCLINFNGGLPRISSTEVLMATTWGVPYYAKNAEKSIQLLNLMYTDANIANLLGSGIEGMHYEVTADGFATFANGLTSTTTGYYYNSQLSVIGNQFLTYPWKGNDIDIWEQYKNYNDSAIVSVARGFSFDNSPVKTEYVTVKSIINEYQSSLDFGLVNPEEILPQFLSKLKDAGIDKVIAEKQKQLDEWLAK